MRIKQASHEEITTRTDYLCKCPNSQEKDLGERTQNACMRSMACRDERKTRGGAEVVKRNTPRVISIYRGCACTLRIAEWSGERKTERARANGVTHYVAENEGRRKKRERESELRRARGGGSDANVDTNEERKDDLQIAHRRDSLRVLCVCVCVCVCVCIRVFVFKQFCSQQRRREETRTVEATIWDVHCARRRTMDDNNDVEVIAQ